MNERVERTNDERTNDERRERRTMNERTNERCEQIINQLKNKKMKRTGLFYLNNSGSRWVILDETGRREKRTFETKSGAKIERRVNFYEAFGNFATANISWNGKKIDVFPDTILEEK